MKALPDFEGAVAAALDRLEAELSPELRYHDLFHTRDDVVPAVVRLAGLSGVGPEAGGLLRVAAAFHDIGFIVRREGHELAGADIAAEMLPRFGFSEEQIDRVRGMIVATRLPQSPNNALEELVVDADLDVLGRKDFLPRSIRLREELNATGSVIGPQAWLEQQLAFVTRHRYFSAVARALRDEGKAENLAELRRQLVALEP